jgi:glutamate carboxypeptidase
VGTLDRMPVREEEGRLHGPGTLDMKGGLTQAVFALRALRALGLEPAVSPVLFFNSDEEIGSPESKRYVRMLARRVRRAFVLEPSLGSDGRIKTARKGLGRFQITIRGRASHAGLDPEAGASAILELSHVIQQLHALNDLERGTTVNVGVIDGGVRPNVVAPLARASVDVRVRTVEDGARVQEAIRALEPQTPGVRLEIEGAVAVPPLERTPRNRILWEEAREAAEALGLVVEEGMAGGGSDGNTTSQFTATLDGLGCVGDGAHADHEHIEIDRSLERCALLARLLLSPMDEGV